MSGPLGQAPVGGQDRLDEITARWLTGERHRAEYWADSASRDIPWLVGQVQDRRTDLAMALTHLRDAMGEIARLRAVLEPSVTMTSPHVTDPDRLAEELRAVDAALTLYRLPGDSTADTARAVAEKLTEAREDRYRLRGLLARLEWVETAFPRNTRACPACDNEPREGHESDCWLAAATKGT